MLQLTLFVKSYDKKKRLNFGCNQQIKPSWCENIISKLLNQLATRQYIIYKPGQGCFYIFSQHETYIPSSATINSLTPLKVILPGGDLRPVPDGFTGQSFRFLRSLHSKGSDMFQVSILCHVSDVSLYKWIDKIAVELPTRIHYQYHTIFLIFVPQQHGYLSHISTGKFPLMSLLLNKYFEAYTLNRDLPFFLISDCVLWYFTSCKWTLLPCSSSYYHAALNHKFTTLFYAYEQGALQSTSAWF